MTLTGLQLNELTDSLWFCLKTRPKREHLAAAALRQIPGLDVIAPRIRFQKATVRGTIWFTEAMFPGYVFANFLYRALHRQVQSVHGVTNVVHFGDRIGVLPDPVVEQLRALAGEQEVIVFSPDLAVGEEVKIVSGAFQGLEAVVTQVLPAKDRVKVLLEFLGRDVEAQVSAQDVLSAKSPRATIAAANSGTPR
jgi:transcriptional antiterminator RfaH